MVLRLWVIFFYLASLWILTSAGTAHAGIPSSETSYLESFYKLPGACQKGISALIENGYFKMEGEPVPRSTPKLLQPLRWLELQGDDDLTLATFCQELAEEGSTDIEIDAEYRPYSTTNSQGDEPQGTDDDATPGGSGGALSMSETGYLESFYKLPKSCQKGISALIESGYFKMEGEPVPRSTPKLLQPLRWLELQGDDDLTLATFCEELAEEGSTDIDIDAEYRPMPAITAQLEAPTEPPSTADGARLERPRTEPLLSRLFGKEKAPRPEATGEEAGLHTANQIQARAPATDCAAPAPLPLLTGPTELARPGRAEDEKQLQGALAISQRIGDAYNSGGDAAAAEAALDEGCRAGIERIAGSGLFGTPERTGDGALAQASSWLKGKGLDYGRRGLEALCMAIKGGDASGSGLDLAAETRSVLESEALPQLAFQVEEAAHSSGIPFLTHLEVETGTHESSLLRSVSTVQPLWEDEADRHHVFTQLSFHNAGEELSDEGFRLEKDTYNAGLAYRYLTPDKNYLLGLNTFYDYAPSGEHERMSIGADAQSSLLKAAANRYFPVSGWKGLNPYYEEQAAAGTDLKISGQIPQLPSWTAGVRGYEWELAEGKKYGYITSLEYAPSQGMSVRVDAQKEAGRDLDVQGTLNFKYNADLDLSGQYEGRKGLTPVKDRVYDKVDRQNIIRVTQRRKESSLLTVTETIGANQVSDEDGARSAAAGQSLKMPLTLTTAGTTGAILRVSFADGSSLTLGQSSVVTVDTSLITLTSGLLNYVSGGTIQTLSVPGGTITLHGTDVDIIKTASTSSILRVRDGSATFTGTLSGSPTLTPGEMARSSGGNVATLTTGGADYIIYTDQLSTQIDRAASPQQGPKVTPYAYEAPRIATESLVPGNDIIFGLRFNSPITVTGGTPLLNLTVGSNSRTAAYVSGSGTNDLLFAYTIQAVDEGVSSITVLGLDEGGGDIQGNGKSAVTTIADTALTLSGSINDVTPPSGYSVTLLTSPIRLANYTAVVLRLTGAEIGGTYNYTFTSDGGGSPLTGSGSVTAASQNITLDTTALLDGNISIDVSVTDTAGNAGPVVNTTGLKDIAPPTVITVGSPAIDEYQP